MINHLLCRTPLAYRLLFPGALWRLPEQGRKVAYLTFDDGPTPELTPWVLDLLDTYGVKGTFFCVGDKVRANPELFAMIRARGHEVGNHTQHHLKGLRHSTSVYMRDVAEAHELIKSPLFRPPHGHLRLSQTRALGKQYRIVMWDVVTRDYNRKLAPEVVLRNVKKYTRNGSIIVFHDSPKAENNLRASLPPAIEWLIREGYELRSIKLMP